MDLRIIGIPSSMGAAGSEDNVVEVFGDVSSEDMRSRKRGSTLTCSEDRIDLAVE